MTPKEKADELIKEYQKVKVTIEGCGDRGNKCIVSNYMFQKSATSCALIAVNLIIDSGFGDGYSHDFWTKVKNELNESTNN